MKKNLHDAKMGSRATTKNTSCATDKNKQQENGCPVNEPLPKISGAFQKNEKNASSAIEKDKKGIGWPTNETQPQNSSLFPAINNNAATVADTNKTSTSIKKNGLLANQTQPSKSVFRPAITAVSNQTTTTVPTVDGKVNDKQQSVSRIFFRGVGAEEYNYQNPKTGEVCPRFVKNLVDMANFVTANSSVSCDTRLYVHEQNYSNPDKQHADETNLFHYDNPSRKLTCDKILVKTHGELSNANNDDFAELLKTLKPGDVCFFSIHGHGSLHCDKCNGTLEDHEGKNCDGKLRVKLYSVSKNEELTFLLDLSGVLELLRALPKTVTVVLIFDCCLMNLPVFRDQLRKMPARVLVLDCAGKDGVARGTCITAETLPMIAEWLKVRDDEAKCRRVLAKWDKRYLRTVKNVKVYLNVVDNRYVRALQNGVEVFVRTPTPLEVARPPTCSTAVPPKPIGYMRAKHKADAIEPRLPSLGQGTFKTPPHVPHPPPHRTDRAQPASPQTAPKTPHHANEDAAARPTRDHC